MSMMTSTKMTKGGQTTVPKEIRTALGIPDTGRVYWYLDGQRAYVSSMPEPPLAVESEHDMMERLEEAKEDAAAGRVASAASTSFKLRTKYGLPQL